jgi:hypothetical protein
MLDGLRLDPTRREPTILLLRVCSESSHLTSKILQQLDADNRDANSPVNPYLRSLTQHGLNPKVSTLAVAAAEAALELRLDQVAPMLAERAYQPVAASLVKSELVRLINVLEKLRLFQNAAELCDIAAKQNPIDDQLRVRAKNLAAQAYTEREAMQTTAPGAFRGNIKDAERQEALERQERGPKQLTPAEEQKLLAQRKLEEAKQLFTANAYLQSVALVQEIMATKQEPSGCFTLLGKCFLKMNWYPEAIHCFRKELDRDKTAAPDLRREREVDLVEGLVQLAERRRDQNAAREAEGLLLEFLVRDIKFRGIKELRDRIERVLAPESPTSP